VDILAGKNPKNEIERTRRRGERYLSEEIKIKLTDSICSSISFVIF
jgi:hypothetical protein